MASWNRFSESKLRRSEEALLELAEVQYTRHRVKYGEDDYVSGIDSGTGSTTIVMLHGYGGGAAIYFRVMKLLSHKFRVVSVDLPGMGMSSRPEFDATDLQSAEAFFVNPLHKFFNELQLTTFILWGHSLGGYLAGCYACTYPERVEKLVLVSAVGVASEPADMEVDTKNYDLNCFFRGFLNLMTYLWEQNLISPGKILSRSGPMSKTLLASYMNSFLQHTDETTRKRIVKYIEMVNLLPPSGELALSLLLAPGAWAHMPLASRLKNYSFPILFVSGVHDWVTSDGGIETAMMSPHVVQVTIIDCGGHHLYIENPEELCNVVSEFIENFS